MIYVVFTVWMILQTIITGLACIFVVLIYHFIAERLQVYYNLWKTKKCNQRWEREHEEFMQRQRKWELEWKLRKEEREKYPLFYWKEDI